jgi:hypothetical protein
MRDGMSMSKGMVSAGYTQAYDTIATRRSLDTSGRMHGEGRPELPPTFVRTGYLPSGFSHDVKLHTNTCMTDGLMSLQSDPVRWQGCARAAKSFHRPLLVPTAHRAAPRAGAWASGAPCTVACSRHSPSPRMSACPLARPRATRAYASGRTRWRRAA